MVAAYRNPDPAEGKQAMPAVLHALEEGVPTALSELRQLGRTLSKRACDIFVYFDRPRSGNGPTEAVNGRLEHLRGSVLDLRDLTTYIARSLRETGGFRPRLHPGPG